MQGLLEKQGLCIKQIFFFKLCVKYSGYTSTQEIVRCIKMFLIILVMISCVWKSYKRQLGARRFITA